MPRPYRNQRGRETELIAHRRWKKVFPKCQVVNSSAPGPDLIKTDPFIVEIKARSQFNPSTWFRQAKKNAEKAKGAGKKIPLVVMRPNGTGPESVDDWLVFLRQGDFLELVKSGLGGIEGEGDRGSTTEEYRGGDTASPGLGMADGCGVYSREVTERVLSAVLRSLAFEPGNYEVSIQRGEG